MNLNAVGIDIEKNVFQVCWVDPASGELVRGHGKAGGIQHNSDLVLRGQGLQQGKAFGSF